MRGTAVGGEPHHFVLVFVDREAEVGRERRVEHAERVRESDLAEERDVVSAARRPARRSPWPAVSVAHSPTPSAVRMAARRDGDVRNAAAAWASWCPVKRIFLRSTPRCDAMMPRTQTFSPSVFFMACGKGYLRVGIISSSLRVPRTLLVHRSPHIATLPPLSSHRRRAGQLLTAGPRGGIDDNSHGEKRADTPDIITLAARNPSAFAVGTAVLDAHSVPLVRRERRRSR